MTNNNANAGQASMRAFSEADLDAVAGGMMNTGAFHPTEPGAQVNYIVGGRPNPAIGNFLLVSLPVAVGAAIGLGTSG